MFKKSFVFCSLFIFVTLFFFLLSVELGLISLWAFIEGWALKNWCFQVVLEKTLESPLDSKEIKPVNPKENPDYSLEGLMLKLKLHYLATWYEDDMNSWLTGKDPDAGKVWRLEEKRMTENEIVG